MAAACPTSFAASTLNAIRLCPGRGQEGQPRVWWDVIGSRMLWTRRFCSGDLSAVGAAAEKQQPGSGKTKPLWINVEQSVRATFARTLARTEWVIRPIRERFAMKK